MASLRLYGVGSNSDEPADTRTPDTNLWRAVIIRAYMDACGDAYIEQHTRRDAIQWFTSPSEEPFSCRWVLHHLGREGQYLEIKRRVLAGVKIQLPSSYGKRGRRKIYA